MKNLMKKDNIYSLIYNELFSKFGKNSNRTIGVEIELPIVSNKPIKMDYIQQLFKYLIENMKFEIENTDNDKNIISIVNKDNKDKISLEYSVNTLEFSLKEDFNIYNMKNRMDNYIDIIQNYLKQFEYKLVGSGINPNYKNINRHCINEDRYLIIEKLLKDNKKNNELFNEFCSYICSIQTHLSPTIEELPDVINVLSNLEWVKGYFYANSYMDELKCNLARDHLWEISNFEKCNTGINNHYKTIDDIVNNYKTRKMHYVKRNDKYYIINSMSIEKYFQSKNVIGKDYKNNLTTITPSNNDIHDFRSYKNIEITRRGTIEVRSDCTQKLDNLFEVVAFNVGVLCKYKKISKLIKKYGFEYDYKERRKRIILNNKIDKNESNFICEIINLVYLGLKERGFNEEKLLKKINEMRENNEKSRVMVL